MSGGGGVAWCWVGRSLCLCGGTGKKVLWEGSLRAALEPHLCTFKPPALLEIEVGDTLREVLDIACVQVFVSGS